jgi:hypothetical protein
MAPPSPVNRTHCLEEGTEVSGAEVDADSVDPGLESTGVSPRNAEHAPPNMARQRRGAVIRLKSGRW